MVLANNYFVIEESLLHHLCSVAIERHGFDSRLGVQMFSEHEKLENSLYITFKIYSIKSLIIHEKHKGNHNLSRGFKLKIILR